MPSAILRGSLALFVLSSTAWGESTTINGVTYDSKGSAAVTSKDALGAEQALRLKKVFLFPSMDDLSGALAPKLDEKLAQLFMRNSRFELIRDPQVVKALSPDEKSYYKAAVSGSVHREAAKVTGADTTVLLRTHNVGPNTQMNLELRDANGNLLFSEEGSVPGSATMEARWALIDKLYSGMLKRLPFEGAITGRTANTITVDLGMGAVRQGEEVDIARIVSVQRHPLLGTVVGTDYVRTGRAKITSVDRVLSFAEVIEETAGEKIAPGQKVLQARAVTVRRGSEKENESGEERTDSRYERPGQTRPLKKSGFGEEDPFEDRLKGEFDRPRPRYGFVGGNLYYGSLGYTQNTTDYGGSGIGGDLNGELWVSKSWILSLLYGFQNANLSAQGTELGSTSFKNFQVVGGFRIFPESVAEGFVLTGSAGYQMMSFTTPVNTTLNVGGKKYSGIVVRADGEIHFMGEQKVTVGFSIQPFSSLTETGYSLGTPSSASVIGLHLGWNTPLMDQIWLKVGMRYDVANGSYEGSSATVSNKRFAIGPGIYYLF